MNISGEKTILLTKREIAALISMSNYVLIEIDDWEFETRLGRSKQDCMNVITLLASSGDDSLEILKLVNLSLKNVLVLRSVMNECINGLYVDNISRQFYLSLMELRELLKKFDGIASDLRGAK